MKWKMLGEMRENEVGCGLLISWVWVCVGVVVDM